MLHDLNNTFKRILIDQGKLDRGTIDIDFEQPTSEWSSHLSLPTINMWCFDVRENVKLRNMDMRVADNGNSATLKLPPLRFDVTYLVTAWAREVEDEHQLLWRALGTLAQIRSLTPEACEGGLREQQYDIPIAVAQAAETSVNMSDLWSVLDNQMRLGFWVAATLAIESGYEYETPLVLERRIGVGQSDDPRERTLDVLDRELIQKAGDMDGRERQGNERQ